ncbi:MAG TPA: TCR/Tet family MFS transporter, partial [Mycoplana sp.]|nr:TCR/Tet family MFS transporter [Mycoplana sp.]
MNDEKSVRRGLALVFMIMFLDVIGIAIIVPVLPTYLEQLTGDDIGTAAVDGGWLLLVYSAMQFLFAPLIGNLSDRFGRRPVLLVSVFTFAIDNLICALATSFWMLFVGRVLAGISGASFGTAAAYIADVSTDETRAKNFGLIGIAFGTGFALGPVIGGFLGEFGPRVPFYGAAALAFVNFAIAWALLPESLEAKHRRRFELARANPLGALQQMRSYPGILGVLLVFFLYWLAHSVYPAVWAFVGAYRYGWSEGQIGLSLGVFGISAALVMAFVLPRVVPVLGEWRTAALGLSFSVLGLAGYAAAWQGWMVYAVILLTTIENLADPPLRSIAAAKVPPSAQGELQG